MSTTMTEDVKQRLSSFYTAVSDDLDRSVEFWLKHSHDKEHGGFFQCLERDGTVYDSTKHCWLLCRQVWMYARLYHDMTRFRLPHILEAAKEGAAFIMKYVKHPDTNKCYLRLTREGKPIKSQRSIFSEAFYIMAMSEMYRVTKDDQYKKEAMTMMKQIVHWVKVDNSGLGPQVAPPVPTSTLAVPMILLNLIDQLETMDPAHAAGYGDLAEWCVEEVLKHVQRDGTVVLENVSADDGKELPGSTGRLANPGHAIECGWFLLQRAIKSQNKHLANVAISIFIVQSYNRGWDSDNGGIYYFLDVDNRPPLQLEWDMKLWWPHSEAMIALLMAYKYSGNEDHLKLFAQVFDYAYQHFVDHQEGEWFGYLSKEGKVKIHAKGGEWKGCFHVPRALMMCEKMLQEILQTQ